MKDKAELRFDFAIFKNDELKCLIEFQGEQHIYSSNGFYSEDLIKHDEMKKEYCQKNDIPLYFLYYKEKQNTQVTWEELCEIKEIKEIIDGI